jgi:hypothetical protein
MVVESLYILQAPLWDDDVSICQPDRLNTNVAPEQASEFIQYTQV